MTNNMLVTSIEEKASKKNLVYIDYEFFCMLYSRELAVYEIREGIEISEEKALRIINGTIIKRAQLKALDILKRSDRSEAELRRKLKEAYFSESVIDEAVKYINVYGYLNDERYAENYIRTNIKKYSKTELIGRLRQKGIEDELIERSFDEINAENGTADFEEAEINACITAINKKTHGDIPTEEKNLEKLLAFLCRKGYKWNIIYKALDIVRQHEI